MNTDEFWEVETVRVSLLERGDENGKILARMFHRFGEIPTRKQSITFLREVLDRARYTYDCPENEEVCVTLKGIIDRMVARYPKLGIK